MMKQMIPMMKVNKGDEIIAKTMIENDAYMMLAVMCKCRKV